jgi:predicted transcriptional regulator
VLTKSKSISFKGVKDSSYYKVSSIILGKDKPFTFKEINEEVRNSLGYDNEKSTIKKSLKKLTNNGLIIRHGSYYSKSR